MQETVRVPDQETLSGTAHLHTGPEKGFPGDRWWIPWSTEQDRRRVREWLRNTAGMVDRTETDTPCRRGQTVLEQEFFVRGQDREGFRTQLREEADVDREGSRGRVTVERCFLAEHPNIEDLHEHVGFQHSSSCPVFRPSAAREVVPLSIQTDAGTWMCGKSFPEIQIPGIPDLDLTVLQSEADTGLLGSVTDHSDRARELDSGRHGIHTQIQPMQLSALPITRDSIPTTAATAAAAAAVGVAAGRRCVCRGCDPDQTPTQVPEIRDTGCSDLQRCV